MQYKNISVIITTFNSSETILKTLYSIVNQLNLNDEILIYDDCSNDATIDIIKEFSKINKVEILLEVSTINNGGPAKGRNWGIKNSKGAFICFCDADDEWLTNKLSVQINFMKKNLYDFCGTRCNVIGSNQYPNVSGEISILSQIIRNKFSLSTLMFNRKCFFEYNIFFNESENYHGVEDYDLILQLYKKKYRGYIVNKLLVNYYHINNSLSHSNLIKSELKRILVLKKYNTSSYFLNSLKKTLILILFFRVKFYELRNYFRKL